MEKILVKVIIPAVEEEMDAYVPADELIKKVAALLGEGVKELTGGRYEFGSRQMLLVADTGQVINPAATLYDYDIGDGSRLFLI